MYMVGSSNKNNSLIDKKIVTLKFTNDIHKYEHFGSVWLILKTKSIYNSI